MKRRSFLSWLPFTGLSIPFFGSKALAKEPEEDRLTKYAVGQHQLICEQLGVSSSPDEDGDTAFEAVMRLFGEDNTTDLPTLTENVDIEEFFKGIPWTDQKIQHQGLVKWTYEFRERQAWLPLKWAIPDPRNSDNTIYGRVSVIQRRATENDAGVEIKHLFHARINPCEKSLKVPRPDLFYYASQLK